MNTLGTDLSYYSGLRQSFLKMELLLREYLRKNDTTEVFKSTIEIQK